LANLARVQVRQERFEQADELLDEALEVLEEQNDGNEQAVALKLSANLERMDLCWALGRVDESLDAARLAIKLLGERRDDRVRWARCRFAVGRALHAKGELEQAELEYRKARELLVQMEKNSFNLAETLRSLAVLCGESGRLKEAQEFYLECLEMLVALKSPQVSMVVVEYSELLKAMGRSEISESIADIVSEGVADQVEAAMSRKEKSH
jgi:tetratricopeptide (TPR) repeat protein